jgi:hypothetical protein
MHVPDESYILIPLFVRNYDALGKEIVKLSPWGRNDPRRLVRCDNPLERDE